MSRIRITPLDAKLIKKIEDKLCGRSDLGRRIEEVYIEEVSEEFDPGSD